MDHSGFRENGPTSQSGRFQVTIRVTICDYCDVALCKPGFSTFQQPELGRLGRINVQYGKSMYVQ